MNIAELILSRGQDSAEGVRHRDAVLTYAGLREAVARLAGGLLARGHLKGDRVGIFAENNLFSVKVYLGIIRAGLVAVPLPTDLTAEAFAKIAADAGVRELFVSNRLLHRARPWAGKLGLTLLPECQEKEFTANPLLPPATVNAASDLASLMFTSGSTGLPKGVMITHRNIECNSRDIIAYLGLHPGDRVMAVLPFHYCFGLSLLHTHLMAGARAATQRSDDPAGTARRADRHGSA